MKELNSTEWEILADLLEKKLGVTVVGRGDGGSFLCTRAPIIITADTAYKVIYERDTPPWMK
jgi:hypothetical protein